MENGINIGEDKASQQEQEPVTLYDANDVSGERNTSTHLNNETNGRAEAAKRTNDI
jgi:hypothetical protein